MGTSARTASGTRPDTRLVARALLGAILGMVAGVLLVVAGPAAPAAAHANLIGSDPPNGAVLPEAAPPTEVTLTFSEPVRLVPDRVLVVGPAGDRVDADQPRVDGTEVTIPLGAGAAAPGTYLVSYRVISQDSHPIAGGTTYSVGAPSAEPPVLTEQDVADRAVAVAVSVTKYVGYAGLVLLVGSALTLGLLWPRRLSRRGAARVLWSGMGLIGVSTVAAVWLQAPYTTGGRMFEVTGAQLRDVMSSSFGTAHVVRLGVLTAAALLLRPLLTGQPSRSDLVLLAGLGVVGLGTWPVSGHPIASPVPAVSVAVQTVHIAAAAVWVGGLVMLAGFLLRLANERELSVILPAWSRWAALAVSVLMLAGAVQAVIEIGPPEALVTTSYGRLLLVKIGLFAAVIAVAGYSRRLVRMRLASSRPGALRLAVAVEALVLAAVLVVSSVLVQTTPGRTEAATPEQFTPTDVVTTLDSDLYSLQVQVEPAERGANNVHLYAYTPDGEPVRVEEWSASASLPGAEVEAIEIPLLALTDNHATGLAMLPVEGEWELRFTLRISEIDQASVTATVPIR